MSSSRQNGLQSVEIHANEGPADPETRRIVEGMAKTVAVHGLWIEKKFMDDNVNNDILSFVKSSEHPYHAFYRQKIAEYQNAQNEPDVPATDAPSRDPARSLLVFTCPDEGFTRKEFAIIKLTAQFVVRYGIYFWRDLMTSVTVNPPPQFDFEFMKTTDSRFTFFLGLVDAYERVLIPYRKLLVLNPCKEPVLEGFFKLLKGEKQDEDGLVEMAMIDSHAFVGGLDYFASREGGELSPPGRLSTQMQSRIPDAPATDDGLYPLFRDPPREPRYYPFTYPEGITRKQLGIIKLTAQFLVRYGYGFWLGLMKLVIANPQCEFDFLKSTDLYDLFHRLAAAYSRVLMSCQELCKPGAPTPTESVLDGFFNLLRGEKQEEGAEIAVSDLHAFVGALDYFANRDDEELSPPHGDLSTTMNTPRFYPPVPPPPLGPQSSHPQVPRPYCQTPMPPPPPLPLLEEREPEPRRQNFDESALVPEDQFLVQHPGPSTIRIRVVVQDDNDGQLVEVTVQSLSESVASLKEKIAGEIQIPANKHKISGKTGVLEDNISLAHYNVGAGEILTLSM
ncbi:unnamed protein product [Arabidopsis halleri]